MWLIPGGAGSYVQRDMELRTINPPARFELTMNSTSVNLLQRLKTEGAGDDWARFVRLYSPLIYCWIRSRGLSTADAAETLQEVLATLVDKLPRFEYDPRQRFRGWLRTLTLNKVTDWYRRQNRRTKTSAIADVEHTLAVEPPDDVELREYQQFLLRQAFAIMESEFEPRTWQAFVIYVGEGKTAAEVAALLGMSENAVRVAKCRVQRRLRQEFGDLID